MLALVRPKAVMPVHGEFRMLAAQARLAGEAGVPASVDRAGRERLRRRADARRRRGSSTEVEAGVTFVDGLGVGDVSDVALRDRRQLSEDGVLIVVATLGELERLVAAAPELIARGFAEPGEPLLDEMREEAERVLDELPRRRHHRDQAAPGAPARRDRPARLRPHPAPADDPAGRGRGMSTLPRRSRGWADVLLEHAGASDTGRAAGRAAARVRGRRARVLPAARALGAAATPTPSHARRGGRRRCGGRPTARRRRSPGLERPLGALPARARARARRGPLLVRRARRRRAASSGTRCSTARACAVSATRVAQAYLELAVLVRALEGSRTRRGSARRPTAPRSGPASSTCARTCSAGPWTTCARLPP